MNMTQTVLSRAGRWLWAGLLCLAVGCVTRSTPKQNFIFFPPPPNEPHLQYLTSFGSEASLGGAGNLVEFLTGRRPANRPLVKPYGVAVREGKIYVCDTQLGLMEVADLAQRKLSYFIPEGEAAFKQPINVALDREGTRYVTDTSRSQVLIYGKDDRYLGAIGRPGEMRPSGVAVTDDRLLVSDLLHPAVRVYAKTNHNLLFTIPRQTNSDKGKLFAPTNLTVDQQGRIYVSDTGGFSVQIYDAEGQHLRSFGGIGVEYGQFALPKGIGVDRAGRVYVVDAVTEVVQVFDSEGRLLTFFGDAKTSDRAACYLPAGLVLDYDHGKFFERWVAPGFKLEYLIFVTNQAGPNKVSVYGFVSK